MTKQQRIWKPALLAAAVVCALGLAWSQDQPAKQDYNSGEYLYRMFCATCHGESGRGDGPAVGRLRRRPSDLTLIAARAGGLFPRVEVTRIVDGRQPVAAHDTPAMARWGKVLGQLEADEPTGQRRIDALVKHLESIQHK